jgi:hypothetical protein
MRRKAPLGICLAIALGIVGCQNETTEPAAPAEALSQAVAGTTHHLRLNPAAFPGSARLRDRVFAGSEHVIDPEAYKCRQATRVGNWFNSQLNQIPLPVLRSLVLDVLAPDVAFVDALVFRPQEFGYSGEFNAIIPAIATDVKGFWAFTSNPTVLLGAMKGTNLTNVARVTLIYENFFIDGFEENGDPIPVPHTEAVQLANQLHDLIVNTRSLNGGDHPLFSFNAFATNKEDFGVDLVAMGDGVVEGFAAVGLGHIADLANQAVYAHEFGHQIQFKNGYIDEDIPGQNDETSDAELTRYTELMADGYSGYYLAHQNLGKTNKQQIRDAERAFFNLGDCAFDQGGHHGTPNQREASVDFGMELASRGGAILTQQQFHDLFFAKYPELIAPDKK